MIINWMSKMPKQTYRFAFDDVIMPIIQAWKEIENPIINEEIKNVINKYHIEYLKYSCRVFVNIAIFTLLFNLTIIVLFMNGNNLQTNSAKFIVPMLLTVLFGIKFITDKYIEACKHVFPCLILCFGTALTIENTFFSQFKIYEIWLMFYFFCSLISISICFDWKRIVLAFWIVKFNYIIVMTLTYGTLTIQFYLGIMYACITYPIVSIIITKKILDLLKCIQEKKS